MKHIGTIARLLESVTLGGLIFVGLLHVVKLQASAQAAEDVCTKKGGIAAEGPSHLVICIKPDALIN